MVLLCFCPPIVKTPKIIKKTALARIQFADSKLLKMICDCSDIFEYEKTRKRIIEFNTNIIKKL
jgi:hypothetical protein